MANTPRDQAPILKIENVAISYATRYGDVEAVRQVSFEVDRATTFGSGGRIGLWQVDRGFWHRGFPGTERQDRRRQHQVPGARAGRVVRKKSCA